MVQTGRLKLPASNGPCPGWSKLVDSSCRPAMIRVPGGPNWSTQVGGCSPSSPEPNYPDPGTYPNNPAQRRAATAEPWLSRSSRGGHGAAGGRSALARADLHETRRTRRRPGRCRPAASADPLAALRPESPRVGRVAEQRLRVAPRRLGRNDRLAPRRLRVGRPGPYPLRSHMWPRPGCVCSELRRGVAS